MHDFTIPIGPQNPSLKEPTCLRIDLKGNYIQSARIRLGYIHRGLERLLEGKDILKALYIIQRICGICPATHAISYTRAIESALKIRLEEDVVYLRMLEAELERIASHLLWAGYMSHEIGYDMLFMFFWRERERVLEIFEKVMGGRIHRNNFKIGSVRYGLEKGDKRFI
ncbi:MAG: nickel-dependent hydrogenase large subunit, partial [Candidatus Aenigmatarchaeota archaeon]